jgi:hypothetical protein
MGGYIYIYITRRIDVFSFKKHLWLTEIAGIASARLAPGCTVLPWEPHHVHKSEHKLEPGVVHNKTED